LWLDPAIAIAVGLNILREGFRLVWRSSQGLMDEALDAESLAALHAALDRIKAQAPEGERLRFDDVVTRRAGQRLLQTFTCTFLATGPWSARRVCETL
jgi:divalent metal cation (Fe/Co/Zn/Cd) transporter